VANKIATLTKKIYSIMMNAKDTLKQVRVLLGFDEETKVEFATATLTDGTIISWEGDLAVGTAIMVQTADGDIPAPDATHELEDGTLVTTVGGVVTEIVSPETETPEIEVEVQAEEFATISKFNEVVESLESKISDLNKAIESLVAERASHKEAMSKVVDLCEKMIDLPSDEPTKKPHTPTKQETQFENLKKFANSLKK
jgi:exonuclease VII small subunit